MASRGFLIRFIDIGLIVLFGFLMISEIESLSQVELAAATENEETDDDPEDQVFLMVAIAPDGAFTLSDAETGTLLALDVRRAEVLEQLLLQLKREYADGTDRVIVLIRPHEDSVVQRTVDVMDICDRLALGKSLQMDMDLRSPGEGA